MHACAACCWSARVVRVRDIEIGNDRPLAVIAGPCQLEGRDHALRIAEAMTRIEALS